jgi:hypothetical protein
MVHGCYDSDTLRTLQEIGVRQFGFDLRGRSPNLIPFHQLQILLKSLSQDKVHLIFENDLPSTIFSFLNLLKDSPVPLVLEFRDRNTAAFYDSFNTPFSWLVNPEGEWENILMTKNLEGLLLPLTHQKFYQRNEKFWDIIERRHLSVHLHANTLQDTTALSKERDVLISLDLSREFETGFRRVDQNKLKRELLEIF